MGVDASGGGRSGSAGGATGSISYKRKDAQGKEYTATAGTGGLGYQAPGSTVDPGGTGAAFKMTTWDPVSGGVQHDKSPGGKWTDTPIARMDNRNPMVTPGGAAVAAPQPQAPPPAAGPGDPGVLGEDGYLEALYKQRGAGTDPYYDMLRQRGGVDINNQFSARGGFNSSGATNALGSMYADLGAREMRDRVELAAAASGERRGRFDDMWNRSRDTSDRHTKAIDPLYKVGDDINTGNTQSIQLELDKMGVDPAMSQQILNMMFSGIKTGASAYGEYAGGRGKK